MESAQLISLENRFYRIFSHTKGFSRFGTRSAGSTLHDPQQWVWKCCVGHSTSTGRGRSTNNYHWHNRNWNHSCHNCNDHAVIVSHCKILKLSSDLMLPLDWIWVDHWIECLGWICDSFIPRSSCSASQQSNDQLLEVLEVPTQRMCATRRTSTMLNAGNQVNAHQAPEANSWPVDLEFRSYYVIRLNLDDLMVQLTWDKSGTLMIWWVWINFGLFCSGLFFIPRRGRYQPKRPTWVPNTMELCSPFYHRDYDCRHYNYHHSRKYHHNYNDYHNGCNHYHTRHNDNHNHNDNNNDNHNNYHNTGDHHIYNHNNHACYNSVAYNHNRRAVFDLTLGKLSSKPLLLLALIWLAGLLSWVFCVKPAVRQLDASAVPVSL